MTDAAPNIKKGLAGLRQHAEEEKAKEEARNRPKAEYLSSIYPKKTGDTIEGRFLQELDEGSANYDAERGLGFFAVEHEAPGKQGFQRRGLCTVETEGRCFPDERRAANYEEGWKTKTNFYINFLTEFEGEKKVFVLSRNANSTFAQALVQDAVDEGSITDANYRITKTGSGTQTQWILKRLKGDPLDDTGVELFDLEETVIRDIPYADQAKYYGAVFKPGQSDESDSSTPPADESW